MTKPKLRIFGDSFAVNPPDRQSNFYSVDKKHIALIDEFKKVEDNYRPWMHQVADKLDMELVNRSAVGISQDWTMDNIHHVMNEISPDDQVLILLTHPARFWFFHDKPTMTNANIANIDQEVDSNRLEAVKHYLQTIQRPPLDLLMQSERMGWLSATAHRLKWKPIQIVYGFPPVMYPQQSADNFYGPYMEYEKFENLKCSKGNLLDDVESLEVKEGIDEFELWEGYDTRYNHLIKSNHVILSNLIVEAIKNKECVDLKSANWVKRVIDFDLFDNVKFCEKEMNPYYLKLRKKFFKGSTKEARIPWAERLGIFEKFAKKPKKD